MAILEKGTDFSSGDQVTSANLDALVDSSSFVPGASGTTDDSSMEVNGAGRLQVKDLGISSGKIAADAVTTDKIVDSSSTTTGVTFPKIRRMKDLSVIGNVSGGSSSPSEVDILDEDDMASDSDTSLVTQQSVAAYIGNQISGSAIDAGQTWQDLTGSRAVNTDYTNSTGGPIMVYARVGNSGLQYITITSDGVEVAQATSTNTNGNTGCNAIIPNGAVYRVVVGAGGTSVKAWSELRP